jgi:DNA-damage-inducible protein J
MRYMEKQHKTEFVRARIEPKLKAEAHAIFDELGVTPTQVITMLYKQIQNKHALPFDLSLPNAETARAIKEARKRKDVVICKDAEDMFKKLGI